MLNKLLLAVCLVGLFLSQALGSEKELQLLSRSNIVLDDPGLSAAEWRWVREHQRLRLAVWQPMSPPFDITTGLNDYGGINADFIGLIANNLNVKVEVTRYDSYADALEALKAGRADILAQADLSQQKAGLILSQPYSKNNPVEVINIDTPRNRKVENIAVCAGYDPHLIQARYPGAKVTTYYLSRHALEALAFRHLDLFICDAITTQYLISQSNLSNLSTRSVNPPIKTIGFSFAALEQHKEWIQVINKVLKALPGTVGIEIHRRWNGGIPLSLSEQRPLYTSLEKKWIEQHREIRVAVVAENMPVSWFTPAGQLRGIIADILTALRLRTGFVFKIHPYPSFEAALQAVENGESDVIAGAIEESIWQHHLLTTRTWLYNSWVMVGRSGFPPQKHAPRIVVQSAQAPEQWLGQHVKEPVDNVESWRAGLERVIKGKSDIMIMPLIIANEWLSSPDYSKLKILGSVDTPPMRFSFGASDHLYPLITVLNKALINIPPEDLHAITRNGSITNELALSRVNPLLAYKKLWIMLAVLIGGGIATGAWRFILLHRRLQALTQSAKRAEETSEVKSAFLATMSHEIRTHISAVSGMLELVMQRPQDANINQQRIQIALQAAQTLLALTGNILDVSRIEAGKLVLHPERVSLLELIESVAVLFESQALQKGLSFQLELDSELEGQVLVDPLRLRQITSNLLSNAIKFTPSGSVTLRATGENTEPGKAVNLRLEVEDTGKGIDPAVQRRLFQPFSQGEERSTGQGSGLGLYICRKLAEMMGGEIALTSTLSQGTQVTVHLRLPCLAPVVMSEPVNYSGTPQQKSRLTVLVVEDNPAGRMLIEHQLMHLGHRVICFASAAELLRYLEKHTASLVITDCNMPGMDGFKLASVLRSRFPALCVLGVTADARDSTRGKALEAGMDACLFKPVTLQRLADSLQNLPLQQHEQAKTKAKTFDFALPAALLEGDNARAFLLLQLSELEETLAWLANASQATEAEIKSRLHRLRGGLQLLGVVEIEALCLSLEQHPRQEALPGLEAALSELHGALKERLQTLSTVLQHDEDAGMS